VKAFIIFRDRVSYGRSCAEALDAAGQDVVIVDHGTTWPEAVDWLRERKKGGTLVIDVPSGGHPRELWSRPWFKSLCGRDRYIVTDPDVVPSEDCPLDWPQYLSDVLDRFPSYHKAGLGLRLDRIPDCYPWRDQVREWEGQFWKHPLTDDSPTGRVYHADVDTTMAVHIPLGQMGCHSYTAVRTGPPYVADHLAWHEDTASLTGEQQYYHDHAEPGISFWSVRGRSQWGE
jgi:hypothetical protein